MTFSQQTLVLRLDNGRYSIVQNLYTHHVGLALILKGRDNSTKTLSTIAFVQVP